MRNKQMFLNAERRILTQYITENAENEVATKHYCRAYVNGQNGQAVLTIYIT